MRRESGVSTARELRHRGRYAAWEARHSSVGGAWNGANSSITPNILYAARRDCRATPRPQMMVSVYPSPYLEKTMCVSNTEKSTVALRSWRYVTAEAMHSTMAWRLMLRSWRSQMTGDETTHVCFWTMSKPNWRRDGATRDSGDSATRRRDGATSPLEAHKDPSWRCSRKSTSTSL